MTLNTGLYKVTNSAVNLPVKPQTDASGSFIITITDDYTDKFKWVINHVGGDIYTIQNKGDQLYAFGGASISSPTPIVVNPMFTNFTIKAVPGVAGTYTIATEDSGVFWASERNSPGSKIITSDNDRAKLSQWVITSTN